MTVAHAIRDHRTRRELTQADLAGRLDMSRMQITYYETGRRLPPPEALYRMALELELSDDELDDLLRLRAGAPLRDRSSSVASSSTSSAAA